MNISGFLPPLTLLVCYRKPSFSLAMALQTLGEHFPQSVLVTEAWQSIQPAHHSVSSKQLNVRPNPKQACHTLLS